MQNTVRLILVLFLIALILNSYNSIKILNLVLNSVNQDLQQRTSLIARQVDEEIEKAGIQATALPDLLAQRMKVYSVDGAVYYDSRHRAQFFLNVPLGLRPSVASRPGQATRKQQVLLVPGGKSLLLIFNISKVLQIERSTKVITYLNLLLMGFAVLLALYFIESTLRPYRALLQAAKTAPASLSPASARNEGDFLIATFQGVIGKLKEKEHELARLHQAEKARADEFQHLNQDLIRSISSGLILVDQTGKIRIFNHAAESILHLERTRILDQPYSLLSQLISPGFTEDIDICFQQKENINRAEQEIKTSSNDIRYLGANIMPLWDRFNNFSGVFCLFTDITEFKLLQEHMAQKEKFATLGEMAAGVAHEFRNSLATITGYVQMLEKNVSVEQQTYTSPIHKELQLLQKVVKDFLSFAGPVQMRVSRVNVGDLLRESIEELKVSSSGTNVDVSMEGNFPEITCDDTMLRQVFTNLLRNAAESMDGTGRIGKVDVTGSTSANGRFLMIDISDNGKGIPAADLPRIFHPFFSTKQNGVGLGLAIAQKLIVQHNGAISVDTSLEGTIFHLQLPLG